MLLQMYQASIYLFEALACEKPRHNERTSSANSMRWVLGLFSDNRCNYDSVTLCLDESLPANWFRQSTYNIALVLLAVRQYKTCAGDNLPKQGTHSNVRHMIIVLSLHYYRGELSLEPYHSDEMLNTG
jgi:hypothetical protein